MSRSLTLFNLLGVLALTVLCVLQWRTNRDLNLDVEALQLTRQTQAAKIDEQARSLRDLNADLDRFREQLGAASLSVKDTTERLQGGQRVITQLTRERDQLKDSVAQWTAAVTTRDDRLREANDRIRDLSTRLNDTVVKYNALVAARNDLIKQVNDSRAAAATAP